MAIQWGIFGILTILTIGGALNVARDRNLFHAALWLLVTLFGVAGFFVLLSAPFLAAVQVLVYMGAIVILIIFAIMLTRRMMGLRETENGQWAISLAVAAIAFLLITGTLFAASSGESPLLPSKPKADLDTTAGIVSLGTALVDPGQYAVPFEIVSLLLTGAMIGAIVIARED
jgi:NADH-quinone oxidoreductase subunit J